MSFATTQAIGVVHKTEDRMTEHRSLVYLATLSCRDSFLSSKKTHPGHSTGAEFRSRLGKNRALEKEES